MDADRFNQACRHLRRDRIVRVRLITGQIVEGMMLRHIEAGAHDGSVELDTRRGVVSLLSSAIAEIEPIMDSEA